MPTTEDERFSSRLEAELDAAHKRITEQNEELDGLRRERGALQERAIEYRDLAETAVDLRQENQKLKADAAGAHSEISSWKARVQGLEQELEAAEQRIHRLEAGLARYDAANERVHGSSHVLDLLGGARSS
jgi:chromosome segregation ATPase